MAQFAVLAFFILGIVGQFSITQSAGLPSSMISPYNDMHLTSGLTSTSITTQKTIMLMHQILLQETSLRMDLEKSVKEMMKEFEQMMKNQAEVKMEQGILNQQLIDNITLLRTENQRLKGELGQMVNNSFSTSGIQTCKCDLTNITSDLHEFEREVRHNVSLSLLDFQKEMNSKNKYKTSIIQSSEDKIGAVSRDMSDIQTALKNLSSFVDRDRNFQASFNAGILVQQENISNVIKDISKKVGFTATITNSFISSHGLSLIFPTIISNVGDGYNNQDGVFTAPIDGTYVFFCKITGANNPGDLYFEFMLNGSAKTRNLVYSRSSVKYRTASNLIVLQLSLGDRVWIRMNRGGSHFSYGAGGDQSFSGFLL